MAKVLDKQEITITLTAQEVREALADKASSAYWKAWGKDLTTVRFNDDGSASVCFLRKEADFDTERKDEEAAA
jgi:hypothetical protein